MHSTPNILLFSTADWDHAFWTNKQHTALQLSERGYRVVFIESLGLRQPTLKANDARRIFQKLSRFFRGIKNPKKNLYVYSPLVIPLHRFALVRKLNPFFLRLQIHWICWKLKIKNPWIWTYNPMILRAIEGLTYSKLIYHNVDDLTAAPGLDSDSILEQEKILIRACDVVFCTSRKLKQKSIALGGNPEHVHLYNNVADYAHFSQYRTRNPATLPEDVASIPKPRIGFIGAISEYKVDFSLLAKTAKKHPDWNFILIGKVGEGQPSTNAEILNLPNIHLLGAKPYSNLPPYLAAFDAVIIPCPFNAYTESMFPMKFFEYLAAGKAVVAADIDSLADYRELFYSYRTAHEFEMQLALALKNGMPNPELCEREAKQNSWENRLNQMLEKL